MIPDRMQARRFELKYRVTEATARAVREFARCHLEPDAYGTDPSRPAYPVHSLYLDSPGLDLFHSTINGDRNRFKLRARFYADDPESPVYLEIKRRVDRCIHKQRAQVRRHRVAALLEGEPPAWSDLAVPHARQYDALWNFCQLRLRLGATPRAHVAYQREAWVSPENNTVRITLDRAVRCELQRDASLTTAFRAPTDVFADEVILELKFTNRFPAWFRQLGESLNLLTDSAAKYVDGVAAISAPHLTNGRSRRATPGTSAGAGVSTHPLHLGALGPAGYSFA
jgi:hypothetical protein